MNSVIIQWPYSLSRAIDTRRLEQHLDLEHQLPEIDAIRITNGQGDVLFGKGVAADTKASYADRKFFAQHRERTVHRSGYDEAKVFIGDHDQLPQVFLHKPYEKSALKDALARAMHSG